MIITDKFVYIHLPKTGGSFVNSALLQAHGIRWTLWQQAILTFSGRLVHHGPLGSLCMQDKHGSCQRIPPSDQHKPILSTIRNPLDYYVSDFEFGWWKRREWRRYYQKLPHFQTRYPTFPQLTFTDYLRLMTEAFNPPGQQDFEDPLQLGYCSASFIKMFARNPAEIFATENLDSSSLASIQNGLYPVHFLTTQGLNQQLYEYLQNWGYPPENIRFILEKERVLPLGKGRTASQKWEQYYDTPTIELIQQKDQLLFELFPSFDPKMCL